MSRRLRFATVTAVGLALALLAACQYFNTGSPTAVGQAVPAFTLNDLDGKPFNIADQKGKVVLINVFATW